ncbi:hypothetical protein [Micromonospora sp. NPDC005174]|uniref:hypothetical protein n=1 Tax=unclassified Micromonospora TaxID=2617518 RepID=UPI0033BBE7C2
MGQRTRLRRAATAVALLTAVPAMLTATAAAPAMASASTVAAMDCNSGYFHDSSIGRWGAWAGCTGGGSRQYRAKVYCEDNNGNWRTVLGPWKSGGKSSFAYCAEDWIEFAFGSSVVV